MKATLERRDLQRSITQLKQITGKGVMGVTGADKGVEISTLGIDSDISAVAILRGDVEYATCSPLVEAGEERVEVEMTDAVALATLEMAMKAVRGLPNGQVTIEHVTDVLTSNSPKEYMSFAVGDDESLVPSPDASHYDTRFMRFDVPERRGDPIPGAEIMGGLEHVLRAVSTDQGRAVLTRALFTASEVEACTCPRQPGRSHRDPGEHSLRYASGACPEGRPADGSNLRIVATDSFRLHLVDLPYVDPIHDRPVQVGGAGLKRATKHFLKQAVRVVFVPNDDGARYSTRPDGDLWVTTPRLQLRVDAYEDGTEGQWPRYQALLPDTERHNYTSVEVERPQLMNVCKRFIGMDKEAPIQLTVTPDTMECQQVAKTGNVSAGMINKGRVACKAPSSTSMKVAFNPVYLRDALMLTDDPTVTLSMIDGMKPAVITGDYKDRMALLMPVNM